MGEGRLAVGGEAVEGGGDGLAGFRVGGQGGHDDRQQVAAADVFQKDKRLAFDPLDEECPRDILMWIEVDPNLGLALELLRDTDISREYLVLERN